MINSSEAYRLWLDDELCTDNRMLLSSDGELHQARIELGK